MWRVSNPPLLLCRTSINNDYVCLVLCGNILLYSKLKRMAQEQAVELKGIIKDIQLCYDKSYFPKTGANAGHELFKHKVILHDKSEGVFFQRTKELMFNKEKCYYDQEICYTARPSTVEGKPTVFTMCNERDEQTQPQSGSSSKDDLTKSSSMGFSYAKDTVVACYEGQGKTLDEYVKAIKETASDFKKFLLENN